MKKIEAVIRPEKMTYLKKKLSDAGYSAMTIFDVRGRGKQSGVIVRNNIEIVADFLPKTYIIMVVNDGDVNPILEIILNECSEDHIGDGKIFISTVDEVLTVRTRERSTEI
jgi:nitrogen regulatory protein P-II 1